LGFAATRRYLGCAALLHGEIVLLKTRRVASDSKSDADATVAWAAGFIERFGPADVAFLNVASAPLAGHYARALADRIHRAVARFNLTPVETSRCEVANALELASTTTVNIRLELARRYPFVAAHVSNRRTRSESDRYWEPAVLGAAAALAVAGRDETPRP
jgi:hypothetical protein